MDRDAWTALLKDERTAIADALRAQQVRTHFANLPQAVGGAVFAALLFVLMERSVVPAGAMLAWVAALAVVLVARLATAALYRRVQPDAASYPRWLLVYRLGILAHGVVWGLTSLLPIPEAESLHQAVRIIVLAGVTASSFTMTAFDLAAALCFGAPVFGLLSLKLFMQPDAIYWTLGVAVIGTLAFLILTARRSHQVVRNYVALRLAESSQAEALRSSEELLERTGATANVGGWELDVATQALRLTAQAYRIHDAPPSSKPSFEGFVKLYGHEQQAEIRAGLAGVVERGTPFDSVLPLVTPRGNQRWVRLIGQPQFEGGEVVRINGVVQDVSQNKLAELALAEQHHLLSLLVRTTNEGFWFIDPDTITTDVNPAMCRILGRSRDEIIGKNIFEFVDPENAAIFRSEVRRRAAGVASGYEIALSRPDGTQVMCFNNATPIFDRSGRRIGAVGMFADISERKLAEQQLRAKSEQLSQKTRELQVTLDSITQGIVSLDAEGRALVFNRRALALLDLPESLLASGATYDDIVRYQIQRGELNEDASFVDADGERRYFNGGRAHSPEVYVRRNRAGAQIEVRTRQLEGGGLVRTFTDVTAYVDTQRALRESEAGLRRLLDAFPGFIATTDPEYRYSYVNERFAALVGQPAQSLIGRSVGNAVGEERLQQIKALAERVLAGEQVTDETAFDATAERPPTFLQVTHALGPDDGSGLGRHGMYAFGIDISARKAAELALTAAKEEAERANRAKSQFLSSMSHELRTPMNAILGFGQLLISDPKHPLADWQRDHVREILRGARHLLNLINEVLDLALVETGKLQVSLEPVLVSEVLRECLGLLRPLAQADGIDLRMPDETACECMVVADRTRLKQVLLNLLSNAIKYNRPQGEVLIDCAAEAKAVRISISDTGHGLSPEQGARLFRAFERLDAVRTQVEGAGLGLALSKHLMDAMGGEIGLTSEVGRGSRFWIRLPFAAPSAVPAAVPGAEPSALHEAAAPAGPLQTRKVLYIEDNPVNVLLMEAMLERLPGVVLITAPLPMLGLKMAADERPDLVLLDIQLPGMDGFEVLRRLRHIEACHDTPVIAVSANAMSSDVDQGLAAGFVQYLTKPLDLQQLLRAVEAALATR